MRSHPVLQAIVCGFLATPLAIGQVVGPEVLVSSDVTGHVIDRHVETSIGAVINPSTGQIEVVVAWNTFETLIDDTIFRIYYRISNDSGSTFTFPEPKPLGVPVCLGNVNSTDSWVAVSQASAEQWIGGYAGTPSRLLTARKAPGNPDLDASVAATQCTSNVAVDKPAITAGPTPINALPGDGPVSLYFTNFQNGPSGGLRCTRSGSVPPGVSWPALSEAISDSTGTAILPGIATAPLAYPSPSVAGGRIFAALGTFWEPPVAAFSDLGGLAMTWSPPSGVPLNSYGPGAILIDSLPPYMGGVQTPLVTLPNVRITCFPSAAVHPTNPMIVYVIFAGASHNSPNNADLFVAQSIDGGETFDPIRIFKLSDTQLRLASDTGDESDELMPSIGIDQDGGINILFSRVSTTVTGNFRVWTRYARFPGPTALGGTPFLADLAGPFNVGGTFSMGALSNDYQTISAVECNAFVAYVHPDALGKPRVYMRRIHIPCILADLDTNGLLDAVDTAAFGTAYVAGSARADTNGDGLVSALDIPVFQQSFACGCNPQ